MLSQEMANEFEAIYEMLKKDPYSYKGYKRLGQFYQKTNSNQAYLCYEQAWGLCDNIPEKAVLSELMHTCQEDIHFQVHPASFVILSYNAKDMMVDCLESIRGGCVPGCYEIVVVDNNSQDGIRDYLVKQKDIILQLNDHNTSFAEGCNQGVKLASPFNDIFFLNNDTIVPPLALFYMRLSLYEADDIGSVGAMTNSGYMPQIAPGSFNTKEQWLNHARDIHLPLEHLNENTVWLVGFALLIRRKAWDYAGNLDERFVMGNREDTEYGFRLILAGYRNVLCHNAFIYHYGHVSMGRDSELYNRLLRENKQRLTEKLGFDFEKYSSYNREMAGMIDALADKEMSILEVGCGFGLMIPYIKNRYPYAHVVGIEKNAVIARIGKKIGNVICIDIETGVLPFEMSSFDYIFLPDLINRFEDALRILNKLKRYLKDDGKLVLLTRNYFHGDFFVKLLKGDFETVIDGDSEIRHFYTKAETLNLLRDSGLMPRVLLKMTSEPNVGEEDRQILDVIKALPNCAIGEELNVVSYIITATLG